MSNDFEILKVKRNTKNRLYGLKYEYPRQTFDNVLNNILDEYDKKKGKKKYPIFGRI